MATAGTSTRAVSVGWVPPSSLPLEVLRIVVQTEGFGIRDCDCITAVVTSALTPPAIASAEQPESEAPSAVDGATSDGDGDAGDGDDGDFDFSDTEQHF